jgi:hypothetical protein
MYEIDSAQRRQKLSVANTQSVQALCVNGFVVFKSQAVRRYAPSQDLLTRLLLHLHYCQNPQSMFMFGQQCLHEATVLKT